MRNSKISISSLSILFSLLFLFQQSFLVVEVKGSIFLTTLLRLLNPSRPTSTTNPSSIEIDYKHAQQPQQRVQEEDVNLEGFCLVSIVDSKKMIWERRKDEIAQLCQFEKNLFAKRTSWDSFKMATVNHIIEDFPKNPELNFLFSHHMILFQKILSKRRLGHFIPNSIVRAYFYFITEYYIHNESSTLLSAHNLFHFIHLIHSMISAPVEPELLAAAFKLVKNDIRFLEYHTQKAFYDQLFLRFQTFYNENWIEIYCTLINHLLLLPCDLPIELKSIWISLSPLYRVLTTTTTSSEIDPQTCNDDTTTRLLARLPRKLPLNWLAFFNDFLRRSHFNHTFGLNLENIQLKLKVFWQIFTTFYRSSFFEFLKISIEFKYVFVLEAACIFSRLSSESINSEFNIFLTQDQVIELLYLNFSRVKCSLTISTILIAYFPEITANMIDQAFNKAAKEKSLNEYIYKIVVIKRLLLVTSELPTSYQTQPSNQIWNIPSKWRSNLQQNENQKERTSNIHIDDTELFHSGRVYLARLLGIPITVTAFHSDIGEDVQWSELISFINFFIDRECALRNLSHIDPSSYYVVTDED